MDWSALLWLVAAIAFLYIMLRGCGGMGRGGCGGGSCKKDEHSDRSPAPGARR